MASPENIDIDSLLAPIEESSPTGNDVRDDFSPTSLYQTIKMERNSARAAERHAVHADEAFEAISHWNRITEIAPTILSTQSKDLEIACWFAEAMVRCHGFSGLRDAFKLMHGLIEQYWDNLHPMPDEYGMETRVSCVAGLNGEGSEGVLIAPIRRVDITQGSNPFGLWQYRQALDTKNIKDEDARDRKIESLGFSLSDIEKAVEESSEVYYINLHDDLNEAIDYYTKIGAKLDELCDIDDTPPTRTIVEVLKENLGAVMHLAQHKLPSAEAPADEEEVADDETENEAPQGSATHVKKVKGPIENREDAFKQLLEIATYFRKYEPHSPISYILQKAVKWGNMPLNELIAELIPDSSSRERYSELTGVIDDDNN